MLCFNLSRLIIKNGSIVGFKSKRNAIIRENLLIDVVIGIQGLLLVEVGANQVACGVVYCQVQVSLLIAKPDQRRGGVHLDFFAEVFTALVTWMSIFNSYLMIDNHFRNFGSLFWAKGCSCL